MPRLNLSKTVIGYYPYWINPALLKPADIDFKSLTHVALSFLRNNDDGTCQEPEGLTAVRDRLIKAAHKNNVRVLISFAGGSMPATEAFAKMASSSKSIKIFAKWAAEYAEKHGFDGLDMDWEFPNNNTERDAYTEVMAQSRKALTSAGENSFNEPYYLSLAMPQGISQGNKFDITGMEPHVDTFNIMTYDYYSDRSGVAGHKSPLYPSKGAASKVCLDNTMNYWIKERKMPKRKALIGLAFYGRKWDDCSEMNETHAVTNEEDAVLFAEIEQYYNYGWASMWDEAAHVSYKRKLSAPGFISYDDERSIAEKCDYALEKGYAGAIIWAIGQDNIRGQQSLLKIVGEKFLGTL